MGMSIFLQLRKPNWMVPFPLHNMNLEGYYSPFRLDITKRSDGL